MRALQRTAEGIPPEGNTENGEIEAGGFIFTPETAQNITALALEEWQPRATRILYAGRDDLKGDQLLPASWSRDGSRAEHLTLPGFSGMLASPHHSQYSMPHAALDQLEQWIVDAVQEAAPADAANSIGLIEEQPALHAMAARSRPESPTDTISETVFRFGQNNARFAVISEPIEGAKPATPWVVLSNSGALHTAGPNRLYVLLSRALAGAGICCVRFDFPGIGDSVVMPQVPENHSYQSSNSEEIASLIFALQCERGAKRFVLMGLCSGAYASFHAGLELTSLPIVECVLINPLVFYWKEGMSLDEPLFMTDDTKERMERLNLWQYYLGRMRDVNIWKNLLTARSNTRRLGIAMLQRAWIAVQEHIQEKFRSTAEDPLARDLRALAQSGRLVTFLFARSDPGYGLLMTHAGAATRRYLASDQIHIGFVERANHTFTNSVSRDDFIRQVVAHLHTRYVPLELPLNAVKQ